MTHIKFTLVSPIYINLKNNKQIIYLSLGVHPKNVCPNDARLCVCLFPPQNFAKNRKSSHVRFAQKTEKDDRSKCIFCRFKLGRGKHGHLGLVIPKSEFWKIIGTIYKKLVHPGKLKIEENTALHNAIILQERHNEKLQVFRESTTVEAVFESQIIAAINPMYLKELKNNTRETVTFSITYIFTYLFQQYGEVSSHEWRRIKI